MTNVTREHSDRVYESLKAVSAEDWQRATAAEIVENANNFQGLDLEGKDPETFALGFRLFGRLAHQATAEEFFVALSEGDIPPMKLSAEEMEIVRGGVLATGSLIIGVCVGLAVAGGGIAFGMWLGRRL